MYLQVHLSSTRIVLSSSILGDVPIKDAQRKGNVQSINKGDKMRAEIKRTTLRLTPENKAFWDSLPGGERGRIVNYLISELRKHFLSRKEASARFIARVIAEEIKVVK